MAHNPIQGFYDFHIHCGPEPIPRKYNYLTLAEHCASNGIKGIAKSHFFSTVPWAYLAAANGFDNIYGSIVLNHYVGGINPDAVLASLGVEWKGKSCLKMVWMPTLHAKGHIDYRLSSGSVYDIPEEWCGTLIPKGRKLLTEVKPISILDPQIKDNLKELLGIIARNNLILATGHLTKTEIEYLIPLSKELGVEKLSYPSHVWYGRPDSGGCQAVDAL